MESARELKAPTATATCSARVRSDSVDRRLLYAAVGVAAAAGLFFGWDWLVAVGLSALIISLLPCLVMCALGVCATRMCKSSSTTKGLKTPTPPAADMPVSKAAVDIEPDAPASQTGSDGASRALLAGR